MSEQSKGESNVWKKSKIQNNTVRDDDATRSLGLTQVAILSVITAMPTAAYGTAIADRVSVMVGREVADAQIYVALRRLEDRGLIVSRADAVTMPSQRKRGRPKIYYVLTSEGRRALENAGAYIPSTTPFVPSSEERGRHDGPKKAPKPTPVVV
jgi:DNA-binding PadR family transcriptional regulator